MKNLENTIEQITNFETNTVYTNCNNEIIEAVKNDLNNKNCCVIEINREEEVLLEQSLHSFNSRYFAHEVASDYLKNRVMLELIKVSPVEESKGFDTDILEENIEKLHCEDLEAIKEAENTTPSYNQVFNAIKEAGVNLAFILNETKNSNLQTSINVFIALAKENNYTTAVYTTNSKLLHASLGGNVLTNPEDYIEIDTTTLENNLTI